MSQSNENTSIDNAKIIKQFLINYLDKNENENVINSLTTLIQSLNEPNGNFLSVKENIKDGDILVVNTFENINPKMHNIIDSLVNKETGLNNGFMYCIRYFFNVCIRTVQMF
jgi:hypothetical protein